MSRDGGFLRADLDTGIAHDPKFRRLARLHPKLAAVAFTGYVGLLAESWRLGDRLTALDGWPEIIPWSEQAVRALVEVELLDSETRVPEQAWMAWYGVALAARRRRQAAGSLGGYAKAGSSNATAEPEQSQSDAVALDSNALPSPPSPPSQPSQPPLPLCVTCGRGALEKAPLVRRKGQLVHRFGCPVSSDDGHVEREIEETKARTARLHAVPTVTEEPPEVEEWPI
jgi:hypothetical protein